MKKLFLALSMLFFSAVVFAGSPVYFPQSTNCIDIYNVGGGTQTAATVQVTVSSMTLITTAGLNPGTTWVNFPDADKNTVGEVVNFINANLGPANWTTATGVGGGWVASLSQGSYEGNDSSSMTVVAAQSALTSANKITLATDAVIGISYVIPKGDNRIVLENLVCNSTFGSGSPYMAVYLGQGTGKQVRKETLAATTVDKVFNLPPLGLIGDPGDIMRIDIVNTAVISSSYLDMAYFRGK